jgi:peroxiredoxin
LPVPVDDGAAAHLTGMEIPSIRLESIDGGEVDIRELSAGQLVLYVFPKMGRPDKADPPGWDEIPGARGCTQESRAYRDLHQEFAISAGRWWVYRRRHPTSRRKHRSRCISRSPFWPIPSASSEPPCGCRPLKPPG